MLATTSPWGPMFPYRRCGAVRPPWPAASGEDGHGHEEFVSRCCPRGVDDEPCLLELLAQVLLGELGADLGEHLLACGEPDVQIEVRVADPAGVVGPQTHLDAVVGFVPPGKKGEEVDGE